MKESLFWLIPSPPPFIIFVILTVWQVVTFYQSLVSFNILVLIACVGCLVLSLPQSFLESPLLYLEPLELF